jgi:hypothetical protein
METTLTPYKIATSQSKEALVLAIKKSQKRQLALTSLERRSNNQGTYKILSRELKKANGLPVYVSASNDEGEIMKFKP